MAKTLADQVSDSLLTTVLGYGKNDKDAAVEQAQDLCELTLGKRRKPQRVEYNGDQSWTMLF